MASRFLITGGVPVTWSSGDTSIWSASSGGATGASVPGSGDTVTMDAASGGSTVTLNYSPTVTSITMGAFTGTFNDGSNTVNMTTFSGTGTGTRVLTKSGTWNISGNNATVWTIATATNLTFTDTGTTNFTYSGSTGTRTLTMNSALTYNNVNISAGSDIVIQSSAIMNTINFTGFTGSWSASSGTLSLSGNLILGTSMTVVSSANAITFTSTSAGNTITSNSVQINRPFTFNGVGGDWTLQDNLDMGGASSRTLTLTNGSFDANNKNVTAGIFSSNNSNIRTLTMGSGTWTLTNTATSIWQTSTATNMTFSSIGSTLIFSGAAPTFSLGSGQSFNNVQFTNANPAAIFSTSTTYIISTLIINSTGTVTLSGATTSLNVTNLTANQSTFSFTGSGTQTLTSNNQSFYALTVNKTAGQSLTLQDALICTNTLTLTQGTLNANNFNVTCANFSSSNANTRVLTLGTGTTTLTGTGTVWDTSTATNLTVTATTGTIKLTDTSTTNKTFAGGGLSFGSIWFSGSGATNYIITGSNTFANFKDDNSTAHTVQFTAGTTTTITSWTVTGTFLAPITLKSTSVGAVWTISDSSGTNTGDYLIISDSTATGGATWYAGGHSTDAGDNTGWTFGIAPTQTGDNAVTDANGAKSLLFANQYDGTSTIRMVVDSTSHAVLMDIGSGGTDLGRTYSLIDANSRKSALGTSTTSATTPETIYANPTTGRVLANGG